MRCSEQGTALEVRCPSLYPADLMTREFCDNGAGQGADGPRVGPAPRLRGSQKHFAMWPCEEIPNGKLPWAPRWPSSC